jgi:hypothetical protein
LSEQRGGGGYHGGMRQAILRWVLYFGAILVVGPLGAALVSPLRNPAGGADATPLVSTVPPGGLLAALGALGLALLTGILTARLVRSVRAGMIAAGLVLVWVAFSSAETDDLLRAARSVAPLWVLSLEGAVLGLALVASALVLVLFGGRQSDDDVDHAAQSTQAQQGITEPRLSIRQQFMGEQFLLVIGAGFLAGGVAAAFVAVTPLKGQAIGAAILGSVCAGLAGRLVNQKMPLPALFVPVALLAVAGPIAGALLAGAGEAGLRDVYRGTVFPLAHILPLDWVAGAFLGIPLGVSWAASMMEKHPATATT